MELIVREMKLEEVDIRIDYFLNASPEYLETLGVDPTRRPTREAWKKAYEKDYARRLNKRNDVQLLWLEGDEPIGFSSADAIEFGKQANMHLHILDPEKRRAGYGAVFVRNSAVLYFSLLNLEQLFCQPNAFNIAPNRTLQKAGFKYLKTYHTVPASLNYYQVVTKWGLERGDLKNLEP